MSPLGRAFLGAVLVVTIVPFAAVAMNPGSQRLTNLVGTWTCTYNGVGGTKTSVSTGSRLSENWVQLKNPTGSTLVTYDNERKMWVQFRMSSSGDYGLATADGSPTAKSLTWKSVFPPDVRNGTTTISWPSSSKRIITSAYMDNGKPMRRTGVCTKQ